MLVWMIMIIKRFSTMLGQYINLWAEKSAPYFFRMVITLVKYDYPYAVIWDDPNNPYAQVDRFKKMHINNLVNISLEDSLLTLVSAANSQRAIISQYAQKTGISITKLKEAIQTKARGESKTSTSNNLNKNKNRRKTFSKQEAESLRTQMETYNAKFRNVSQRVMQFLDQLTRKGYGLTDEKTLSETMKQIQNLLVSIDDHEVQEMYTSWIKLLNNAKQDAQLLKKTYTAYKNTYDKKDILNFTYDGQGRITLPDTLKQHLNNDDAALEQIELVLGKIAESEVKGGIGKQIKYASHGKYRKALQQLYDALQSYQSRTGKLSKTNIAKLFKSMRSAVKYNDGTYQITLDLTNTDADTDTFSPQLGYIYEEIGTLPELEKEIAQNILFQDKSKELLSQIRTALLNKDSHGRKVLVLNTTVEASVDIIDNKTKNNNLNNLINTAQDSLEDYINNDPITNLPNEIRKLVKIEKELPRIDSYQILPGTKSVDELYVAISSKFYQDLGSLGIGQGNLRTNLPLLGFNDLGLSESQTDALIFSLLNSGTASAFREQANANLQTQLNAIGAALFFTESFDPNQWLTAMQLKSNSTIYAFNINGRIFFGYEVADMLIQRLRQIAKNAKTSSFIRFKYTPNTTPYTDYQNYLLSHKEKYLENTIYSFNGEKGLSAYNSAAWAYVANQEMGEIKIEFTFNLLNMLS